MSTLDDVRLARAYLMRVAEPPAPHLAMFVAKWGAVAAAEQVRAGTAPNPVFAETAPRRNLDVAEDDIAAAQRRGARLVIPEDPDWPSDALTALTNAATRGLHWATPPLGLWVRGDGSPKQLLKRAVSVVGARSATRYGMHVASDIGAGLAAREITVVSGAAYGIDGAAHQGALRENGSTIAVLACGVDIPYPAGNSRLLEHISQQGLVISEYPPGTTPARHHFLVRNRLIAAVSSGTVVIEAGRRSGWLKSAASVDDLGRILMAVPGPVTSSMSVACHLLIRDGQAILVNSVTDVVESVGLLDTDAVAD